MSRILQFSMGPVQDFVARSRRTRDLLCSSFLLSYLSGHAMMRVIQQQGTILFPVVQEQGKVTDELLDAIQHEREGYHQAVGPWVGSIPNRFQASIPDDFDPQVCVQAVEDAWKKIADVIWRQVIAPVASLGDQTAQIWERQTTHFWEMQWVIGAEPDLLRRRKYWRDFVPTVEPGDKCMLFPHLQELSGYVGSGRNASARRKQQAFWSALCKRTVETPEQHSLDLGERERLSAIGLIKRFLPNYAKEAIGWGMPDEARFFPSTQVLASLPWRKKVFCQAEYKAREYAKEARKHFSLSASAKRFFDGKDQQHPWVLMNHQAMDELRLEGVPTLQKLYADLCHAVAAEPEPTYALLLMDGDQLGDWLQVSGQSSRISQALSGFTQSVHQVVSKHLGVLIYAGGDDVFALFPYHTVLAAAVELRDTYQQAFREYAPELEATTLSASLVFANQKTPFQQLIPYAHHQLDQVAKERHGRNSLAVSLYNQSGEILHWAAPWEKVVCEGEQMTQLEKLASSLPLSQSFLYQCKVELEPLSAILPNEELSQVAMGEWERINQQALPQDREDIAQLIDLGTFSYYQKETLQEKGTAKMAAHRFTAEVAHLIRWLRQRMDEG